MEPIKKIGPYNLFSTTAINYLTNNILPAKIGEFIKAYVIGKTERVSMSASFATIVVERILDLLSLFILLLAVLFMVTFPPERAEIEGVLRGVGEIAPLVFIAMLLFLYYLRKKKDLFKRLALRLIHPFSKKGAKKVYRFLDAFASGLHVLKRGRHLLPITFHCVAIWLLSALPIYLALIAFGHQLPFSISLFILVLLGVAVSIPSAPGFIGTFHFACAKGLELFSLPGEEALSVAIVLHALNFFPISFIGAYFLWRGNISLLEAERLDERSESVS